MSRQNNEEEKTSRRAKNKLDEDNNMLQKKNILTFSRGFCSMFCITQMYCRFFFTDDALFFPLYIRLTQFKRGKYVARACDIHKRKIYIINR